MHNDDVSISISFEGNEKDVGDAVRSLADTLKGATALQRATIKTETSPPAEGSQGGAAEVLMILASTGLAPYALDYARSWWRDHHPVATLIIKFNDTTISRKIASRAQFERVCDEFRQMLLNRGGTVA